MKIKFLVVGLLLATTINVKAQSAKVVTDTRVTISETNGAELYGYSDRDDYNVLMYRNLKYRSIYDHESFSMDDASLELVKSTVKDLLINGKKDDEVKFQIGGAYVTISKSAKNQLWIYVYEDGITSWFYLSKRGAEELFQITF